MNSTPFERLKRLFSLCDLTDEGEIKAYSNAIDYVISILSNREISSAFRLFEFPSYSKIKRDLGDYEYRIVDKRVYFSGCDDKLGKIVEKYFNPLYVVYLEGSGLTWKQLDSENKTADKRDSEFLRWSMIESRCLYE